VGLQSADAGTVGALVVPLKQSLHITSTQVGLLVTVSTGVGSIRGPHRPGPLAVDGTAGVFGGNGFERRQP